MSTLLPPDHGYVTITVRGSDDVREELGYRDALQLRKRQA